MSRPLIAILRGIQTTEAIEVCRALVGAGFTRIEVPLNSPTPFDSISKMIDACGSDADIGAGTVLNVEQVERLAEIGAKMVISPNCNVDVIAATKKLGLKSYPGVMTPSECFAALDAGADGLKFFPSNLIGIGGFSAFKAILPEHVDTFAVGGVGPDNFGEWLKAGITGFGIGSLLYKPGDNPSDVAAKAHQMIEVYDGSSSQ